MGDLSEHFSRSEFACKGEHCCGGSAPLPNASLILKLEGLRSFISFYLGKDTPLHINSGFRCLVHNREIGSTDSSQHPLGLAVDINHPDGIEEEVFYTAVKYRFEGIGRYDSFTHVDIRTSLPVHWDNRTKSEPIHAT